jgi:hypothetical protein
VKRPLGTAAQKLLRDLHLGVERQADLDILGEAPEASHGERLAPQVDPVVPLDLVEEAAQDELIEVVASELAVAGGGSDLAHAAEDFHDRDVERAAAEVVDEEILQLIALPAVVDQRCAGWLVEQPRHANARQLSGAQGRFALRVVEVGRHRHHHVFDWMAGRSLGAFLELAQKSRRNLLGAQRALADRVAMILSHPSLDRANRALGPG